MHGYVLSHGKEKFEIDLFKDLIQFIVKEMKLDNERKH